MGDAGMNVHGDPTVVTHEAGGVQEQEILIPEFPQELLKPGKLIVIVGKRGSGKSVLAHAIFRRMSEEFDFCIGLTETQSSAEMFEEIMPPSCVYIPFDETAIQRLIDALRALRANGKSRRILVVMDDLMAIKGLMTRKEIKDIHLNGRHIQIFFVNLVQYAVDVPKQLRNQINLVFAFVQREPPYIKTLWANYFSSMDYHDFLTVLPVLTDDFGCIVCDRETNMRGRFAGIYFFKADKSDTRKYLLGNRNLWKLHHMFYKPQLPPDLGDPIPGITAIESGTAKFRGDKPLETVAPQEVASKRVAATTGGTKTGRGKASGPIVRTTIIKKKRVPAPENRTVTELDLGSAPSQSQAQALQRPPPAPRVPSKPTVVFA